jgi:ribosomal protein L37AE/L43A
MKAEVMSCEHARRHCEVCGRSTDQIREPGREDWICVPCRVRTAEAKAKQEEREKEEDSHRTGSVVPPGV